MEEHRPPSLKLRRVKEVKNLAKIQKKDLNLNTSPLNPSYLKPLKFTQHILRNGTDEEKREITKESGKQLYIQNKEICGAPVS